MACTRTSPGPSGGAGMGLGRLVAQGRPSGSHKLRDDAARRLDAVAPLSGEGSLGPVCWIVFVGLSVFKRTTGLDLGSKRDRPSLRL
ncbi:hypothetical protein E2C01_060578 [Portunus trituberculatus]|uniref:Uncharacterized protein n=1 Tax=Portunus trituberculatus TaxID=210409 RepID=A0A5B7H1K0_PORTR|nr:hypothetical protein [Portunus trituberculatus]